MKELKHQYSGTVKKVNVLTRAEQTLLEEFLSRPGVYNSLFPLITVMLYTGIRVGELGGLKWSDIDFENNEIRMREAGADIKATSDIMGHHEVDITLNTYTDTSDEFKRKEISLLDSKTGNRCS